ncbi:MAG: LL-diaminopimelate aminotransferase [Verrucomicrobiota bacterium]|nr:LL-diaminopimelate aminotransferase [Verrucomicrobiota bacterium]
MDKNYLQELFSERIGGKLFGKDTTIYKFEKIKRAKMAAKKQHPDIELIDMGVGEPDEMAFPQVINALAEEAANWENRTYADNGIPEFTDAVVRYMKNLFEVELDVNSEVCHSIGSKSALHLIPACFINPGDITIMTVPGYPVMGTWTKYFEGEVVNMPLLPENGFFPDLDSLSETQKKKAKLLYLNYPNNPTGASASEEQFKKAINFAKENNILIISDAAYAPLNFSGAPLSILSVPGGKDVAIELHSMSKGFNMTGWRLSWVCGNSLAVKAFATVKDNADSGQFMAIQKASVKALDDYAVITPEINKKYSRRLKRLAVILNKAGFSAKEPEGSFYMYVKIPRSVKNGPSFDSAEKFSEWLIKEQLISTVPWDDAGNYVRFSATFVAGTLEEEERVMNEVDSRLNSVELEF